MITDERWMSEIQEKKFVFSVEQEKLLNNVEALNRQAEQISLITRQLKSLCEELAFVMADMHSLQRELNQTAIEFGLQPIPTQLTRLSYKSPMFQEE